MKAKSIVAMRNLLQKEVEHASYMYNTRKYNLEQKYQTEWLDSVITDQEKKTLDGEKTILVQARELLDDFENHQW